MGRLSPVWPHSTDIQVARGAGVRLFTESDSYLDFTSGIGVTSTGHCHPAVVAAIQDQAQRLLHGQVTVVMHQPVIELAQRLSQLFPEDLDCFFFANSGSEAVEAALKLARHATGKPNFICFQGAYHGRTFGALALTTAKSMYRSGYQPLIPGIFTAPFPTRSQQRGEDCDETVELCLEQLRLILETSSTPDETAAMVVEPILGEGGYVVPPQSFLRGLREICNESGILLIADEVQTGFGRTGRMFACEHFGLWPDIMVIAKGLGSGMPISGIAASSQLMASWRLGSHGGTYGGNPVCAAAALATIRTIENEGRVSNPARMGDLLLGRLKEITQGVPMVREVRGLGLMVGCDFATAAGTPCPEEARRVRDRCVDGGLILSTCGTQDHVVRWSPPLTVRQEEIEMALRIFSDALHPAAEGPVPRSPEIEGGDGSSIDPVRAAAMVRSSKGI